jgi:hypothetical protein
MNISKSQIENWLLKLDVRPEGVAYQYSVRKTFQEFCGSGIGLFLTHQFLLKVMKSSLLCLIQLWNLLESFFYQHMLCLIHFSYWQTGPFECTFCTVWTHFLPKDVCG